MIVDLTELKDGRVPDGITRRLVGGRRISKFVFPALECVLGGVLSELHYSVWVALVRITEMVYSIQREGWNDENM